MKKKKLTLSDVKKAVTYVLINLYDNINLDLCEDILHDIIEGRPPRHRRLWDRRGR